MKNNSAIFTLVLAVSLLSFLSSCKKEGAKVVPTFTIAELTTVTGTTATIKIEITNDGGAAVTARGVCWSMNQNPTIADNKTSDGTGSGSFTSSITGLTPGSTYYIRAYANNSVGTAYGNQVSTSTDPPVPNDYLPLKVGAKYKYNYSESYTYVYESSIKKGECTWTFISKSVDTPVVYQVEQSFNGYYVYRNYSGQKDSTQIENQISNLSFEVQNDGKVAFHFSVPYWGASKVTFERFIQSDKIDTCFILGPIINRGCLRKNVGITNLNYNSCGNHCSGVSYSLIEGPSY